MSERALSGVSVVIPHYGDPSLAQAAVRDVMAQVVEMPVQIIVVDDASPQPYPHESGVLVLRQESNGGFGTTVNAGAREAQHPWLLVLNSDIRMAPDFLQRFVEAAASLQPAICSPQLLEAGIAAPTANLFVAARPLSMLMALQPLARWRESGRLDRYIGYDTSVELGKRQRTEWLTGACLLLRKSDFDDVGGFDKRFHMFCEEVDLMLRLAGRNVEAWYLGDLTVDHIGGGSTEVGTRVPGLMRSQLIYARKHGFAVRARVVSEGVNLVNLGYNLLRDLVGKNVGATATFRRHRRLLATAWEESKS